MAERSTRRKLDLLPIFSRGPGQKDQMTAAVRCDRRQAVRAGASLDNFGRHGEGQDRLRSIATAPPFSRGPLS